MCSVRSLPQSSDLHKRKRTWQAAQVLCCWLLLPGGAQPRGKESLRCVREQAMEKGQRVPVIHSATFSHNASTPGQWARVPVIQQPAASSQQPVQEPAVSSSANYYTCTGIKLWEPGAGVACTACATRALEALCRNLFTAYYKYLLSSWCM